MAFRTLTVDSPAQLHVRSGQLTIQREHDPKPLQIDLDDLACIVLSNLDITLSTGALNAISEHGFTVLGCGRNYMPTSIVLPFAQNSRYSEIVERQLNMSLPFQKQLWKKIITQKIVNQAEVLRISQLPGADHLRELAKTVRSGDPDNREAVAAKHYFASLKPNYVRSEISATSSALNYGYAVLRSTLARAVVSHGFITSVGLHHDNCRNEFNLVDDLIEPFRPMVDLQMLQLNLEEEDPSCLSRNARRSMTGVLRNACYIAGRKASCLIACEEYVISFMKAIESHDPQQLELPTIIPIEQVE